MVKWEYAEIRHHSQDWGSPVYAYLMQDGQMQEIKGFKGSSKVFRALQFMGEQGWELVAAMGHIGYDAWYLKRPKPE
jgi:hypothetical protein